jgi:nucleoside 2-deoxyribosyltransferase
VSERKKRIYIAGPMTGYPRYNVDAFDASAQHFREKGFEVFNPADMDRDAGFDHNTVPQMMLTQSDKREFMRRDLMAICRCDAIALLPGWEKSKGVKAELALAEFLGLDVVEMWPDKQTLQTVKVAPNGDGTFTALEDSTPVELPDSGTNSTPTVAVDEPETILDEAKRITAGDRQNDYGPPDQDFARTAAMWSQLLGVDVEARHVALCMIALKMSRETHQRKRDNWVDIAGYAKCGSVCR